MTTRFLPLTQGRMALIDDADWNLVKDHSWSAGSRNYPRAAGRIGGRRVTLTLHRVIMRAAPGQVVDHINGDPLDNRRCNLRLCTQAENMRNRARHATNTSGFKGVYKRRGRDQWNVQIQVGGKIVRVGTFTDPFAAAVAYDRAALVHHGEFARLNFNPDRDWLLPYPPAVAADDAPLEARRGRP